MSKERKTYIEELVDKREKDEAELKKVADEQKRIEDENLSDDEIYQIASTP